MIIAFLAVIGLCVGSFVNALVWRLRKQETAGKKKTSKKLSISKGRSMCPHCGHELAASDLVPVFSWLLLKGKCRYCHKPISKQYPLVEILTALLFVASYLLWPDEVGSTVQVTANFITWLVLLTGFVALAVYDFKWRLLPDRIVFPMGAIAAILVVANAFWDGPSVLLSTLYAVLIAGGIFFLIYQISDKWIGGGDITLGVVIGLTLQDPFQAFLMLFGASMLGTLLVLPGLALKKLSMTSKIAYGPLLIASTILVKLFGAGIIEWYKRTSGL